MSKVFGSTYADLYDALYADKDYAGECDLFERLFNTYSERPVRTVVDLGCGTGSHALLLAQRGYGVTGVDLSPEMLAQAETKAVESSDRKRLSFHEGDIRSVDLKCRFDAALIAFAVLGYQLENRDVVAALRTAHRHLSKGALLIFDVWYGPAVLTQGPLSRVKVVQTTEGEIVRAASGALDVSRHLCRTNFLSWKIANRNLVSRTEETHDTRFFFPLELEFYLETCRFALIRLGAFPQFDRDADETTANALVVARAI